MSKLILQANGVMNKVNITKDSILETYIQRELKFLLLSYLIKANNNFIKNNGQIKQANSHLSLRFI